MESQDVSRTLLELLYHINRELVTTLDLHQVLSRLLILSVENIGAERGSIIVMDEKQRPVDAAIVVGDNVHAHTTEQLLDIVEHGLAGWVIRNRQSALVENTQKDPRWLYHPDDANNRSGAKSAICVPIIIWDKLVGVLTIVHPVPGWFNPDRLELLNAIADQAGIAIYNAMLYASLQSMNRRYRELFEFNADPIFITDTQGKILEANQQALTLTHYVISELVNQNILMYVVSNKDRIEELHQEKSTGLYTPYETILIAKDGKGIPVEVYVRDIEFEGGFHVQWILHDITERKTLDQLRDDLGAMIYHDIRSPLSNIVTSLDMLEMMLPPETDPAMKSVLAIVDRSAERVQRLVSSLLDINRLESGQSITNLKACSPSTLLHEAIDAVIVLLESKNQEVVIEADKSFPDINVDEDMIKRTLINLIENASKYSPSMGKVIVKAKYEDHYVRFTVDDSGPGIPEEARSLIFEKFSRLRVDQFPKGIGLGLAFCRLAVEAHGGRIWVESTATNGSSFNFTIPVRPQPQVDKVTTNA